MISDGLNGKIKLGCAVCLCYLVYSNNGTEHQELLQVLEFQLGFVYMVIQVTVCIAVPKDELIGRRELNLLPIFS